VRQAKHACARGATVPCAGPCGRLLTQVKVPRRPAAMIVAGRPFGRMDGRER